MVIVITILSASGTIPHIQDRNRKAKEAKERTMIMNVVNTFRIAKGSAGTSAVAKTFSEQSDATGSLVLTL